MARRASAFGTIAAAALGAVVAACAGSSSVSSQSPSPAAGGGVGYVDMNAVIAAHPMNAEIVALQDQINALNAQSLVEPKAVTPQQLQAEAQLQQELQAADGAFQDELARRRAYYEQREAQAVQAAEAQALGQSPGGPGTVLSGMRQQYGTQIQSMQNTAGKTLLDYRNALFQQDADHLRSVQQQLSAGVAARVRAKMQQYSDAETAYQVELAKQDQAQKLNLKAQLENLALSDKQRSQTQSQLQDIETREEYLINQLKTKDDAALKAYERQQNAEATARFNAERAATESASRAKLLARQQELGTQMQAQVHTLGGQFQAQMNAANQALQNNPKVRAQVEQIHNQMQSAYVADANRSLQDYKATRKALVEKYSAIAHLQLQDNQAIASQIDQLAAQRRDLYGRIVSQVQVVVGEIARKEGIGLVIAAVRAANGAEDLTGQVARAVAALPSTTPAPSATNSGG